MSVTANNSTGYIAAAFRPFAVDGAQRERDVTGQNDTKNGVTDRRRITVRRSGSASHNVHMTENQIATADSSLHTLLQTVE